MRTSQLSREVFQSIRRTWYQGFIFQKAKHSWEIPTVRSPIECFPVTRDSLIQQSRLGIGVRDWRGAGPGQGEHYQVLETVRPCHGPRTGTGGQSECWQETDYHTSYFAVSPSWHHGKELKDSFTFLQCWKSDSVQVNLSLCQFLQIFFCLM